MDSDIKNPKVFISYSWDNKEHKEWVYNLAVNLRSHGIDVILDQFDLRIGDDLPFLWSKDLLILIWLYVYVVINT